MCLVESFSACFKYVIKDSYLAFKSKLIYEKFEVNNCSEIDYEI